jgi:hypothetical protein
MRINPDDEIEGAPLATIRSLFRDIGVDAFVSKDFIRRPLFLDEPRANL